MPTDPPFWSTLLFEQPLPLVVVAAVLYTVFGIGRRNDEKRESWPR